MIASKTRMSYHKGFEILIYGYLAILVIRESLIPVHKTPITRVETQLCLEDIGLFSHLWQISDTSHWRTQVSWRLSLKF